MEKAAFNKLVSETRKWVFATAYNILKNRSEAEDVMQEVYLSLYNNYDSIENKKAVYSWIKRVTINKSINASKKNVFVQIKDYVEEKLFTSHEDSEKNLYNNQMMKSLQDGLDKLSPDHKAMIILREIDGMSYEEIAEIMNCKVGTVMSRLFYARKKLRNYLEKVK